MALSKDDILNAVADMSVMDIVSLIEAMEEKFGVTAAAAVAAAPAASGGDAGAAQDGVAVAAGPEDRDWGGPLHRLRRSPSPDCGGL